MALMAIEVGSYNAVDSVVLITADTDQVPTIQQFKKLYPQKQIGVFFPLNRSSADLERPAHFSGKLKINDFERHQLPDSYTLKNGDVLTKPSHW